MKTGKTYVAFSMDGSDYAFNLFDDKISRDIWANVELSEIYSKFSFSNLKKFHRKLNDIAEVVNDETDDFESFKIINWCWEGNHDFSMIENESFQFINTLRHGSKTINAEVFHMFVSSKKFRNKLQKLNKKYFCSYYLNFNDEEAVDEAEKQCVDKICDLLVKQFGFSDTYFAIYAINETSSMREQAEERYEKNMNEEEICDTILN